MTGTTQKSVYVDTETGGLRDYDRPWEIALIVDEGVKSDRYVFYIADFQPLHADPKALELNGFYDRHPLWTPNGPDHYKVSDFGLIGADRDIPVTTVFDCEGCVSARIEALTRGARVYGCNAPAFDVPVLTQMLNRHGMAWTGHYRPICVTTWAAGVAGLDPETPNSEVGAAFGVSRDQYGTTHEALPDALYARGLHHAAKASIEIRAFDNAHNLGGQQP